MFTGIIRELGRVAAIDGEGGGVRLVVDAPATAKNVGVGDSVAINGVCLTVTETSHGSFAFDAVPETLSRSSLGRLARGEPVNVESALRAGEPLGGHYVQGHVDGVGSVRRSESEGGATRTWFDVPAELRRYLVEKGSVAVEGVSLTVAATDDDGFAVALVPHTLAVTTLGRRKPGDLVNIEVDVLAKYVERLLARA
jgi:riboflavin synthase